MIAATQTAVLNITTMKREPWSTAVVPHQTGNDAQGDDYLPSTRRRCSSRISSAMLVRPSLILAGFVEARKDCKDFLALSRGWIHVFKAVDKREVFGAKRFL
jgi:hypothetical protein